MSTGIEHQQDYVWAIRLLKTSHLNMFQQFLFIVLSKEALVAFQDRFKALTLVKKIYDF